VLGTPKPAVVVVVVVVVAKRANLEVHRKLEAHLHFTYTLLMSAKLARRLLGKNGHESPKGDLFKKTMATENLTPVPPQPCGSPRPRRESNPRPPPETKTERERCRTESMDEVQRYCHLNPPPPPPPPAEETPQEVNFPPPPPPPPMEDIAEDCIEDTAASGTEPKSEDAVVTTELKDESGSEAKAENGPPQPIEDSLETKEEDTSEDAPETKMEDTSGPAQSRKEGSPELSVEAKAFIARCNEMDEGAIQFTPLSANPLEDDVDKAASETAAEQNPSPSEQIDGNSDTTKCIRCESQSSSESKTGAAFVPTCCRMEGLDEACTQPPFKDGFCIDHYRLQKNSKGAGKANHRFLNDNGRARLSVDQHCDAINKKFMEDKSYDTTSDQMEDLKKNFMEMDEDGSGDIDILELGRAMEKLGKPKNQLQLRKMIAEVDTSGTGTIEYEEFVLMMIGTSSAVLRMILMFEKLSKGKAPPPKGKKKPMIDLYA